MDAQEIAKNINASLTHLKTGTLRFWGEWFGRPYDNIHQVVRCSGEGNLVTLEFKEGETLAIFEPKGLVLEEGIFSIQTAARVRWEWFYYGRPKIEKNRYFEEFVNEGTEIAVTTNVNWYSPEFNPSLTEKAVEIL